MSAETLRKWIQQAEVDEGKAAGVSTAESAEIRRRRRPAGATRLRRWRSLRLRVAQAGELLGVVEPTVGEVVRGAQLAQAADRGAEERRVRVQLRSPCP
jgi:hypothetical protein